ncbi:tax1-binding protein 1-like isoform X2 [Acanthaster planci]|uniref:Tax1-binding protein 1-like isoform X2 n=1 Tax=Acanthaster planci TaxID=133434 RepID=A0A8B7Y5G3_ACAPL|nr:tax1-binding protein 1-like isoform X2 [Acanthaster planci]
MMTEAILSRNGEESPTTHLDFILDDSMMTASGYAQVVFHNVQERYAPGSHIECKYTLTPAIRPTSRDWVGIFKVGWSSTRQYKAFDWAPHPNNWQEGHEYEQSVMFSSYYLPKEEDGEFYQFCYIDSAGKMRGASTPFQFLERSVDDFVEVEEESMGLMMIQTKSSVYEEQLKKIIQEKDDLLKAQVEMLSRIKHLECQAVTMEEQFKEQEQTVAEVTADHQELKEQHQSLLREKTILEGRLEETLNALSSLEQDKARCEKALEATKTKLQEAQGQTAKAAAEKDQLVKDLSQVLRERDEFKSQFASSENSNKVLRSDISSLMQQLSATSQANQEVKQQEVLAREEKRRVEQELLVAKADQNHIRSTEQKLQSLEDQYAVCKTNKRMLCEEIDTLKDIQHKLSNDLQRAETDKDALKSRIVRLENEHREREKQLKSKLHLQQHQGRERETMLQEQVQALKESIKQLAEEKEQALRSNKGPMEASQVVMKELKEKLKKAKGKLEEETKKRVELQKKLNTLESTHTQQQSDLTREVSDMKLRLQMGAEEYKKKFLECQQLESKLKKRSGQRGRTASREESPAIKEDERKLHEPLQHQASPSRGGCESPEKSFDNAELQTQLKDLAQELEERSTKVLKYKELYQVEKQRRQHQEETFQKERIAFEMQLEAANSWAQELDEKEEDNQKLREKVSQLHTDYMKMKHTLEVYKFDVLQNASPTAGMPATASPPSTPPQISPIHSPLRVHLPGPPAGQYMFRNPYTEGGSVPPGCTFPNPYTDPPSEIARSEIRKPPGYNPFQAEEASKEEPLITPTAPPLISTPPSLSKIPAVPELPPKNPPDTGSKGEKPPLPEPLKPDVLPEGKIAAIKTVAKKQVRLLDLAATVGHPEGSEEEREEGPNEFHDACEDFPPGEGDSSSVKTCPECNMHFPPTFSEEDFAAHVQNHFARICPMCNMMMPCEMPNADYERHVQTHFTED